MRKEHLLHAVLHLIQLVFTHLPSLFQLSLSNQQSYLVILAKGDVVQTVESLSEILKHVLGASAFLNVIVACKEGVGDETQLLFYGKSSICELVPEGVDALSVGVETDDIVLVLFFLDVAVYQFSLLLLEDGNLVGYYCNLRGF